MSKAKFILQIPRFARFENGRYVLYKKGDTILLTDEQRKRLAPTSVIPAAAAPKPPASAGEQQAPDPSPSSGSRGGQRKRGG